jgi:SAM-dependent methyltransferase
MPENKPYKGHDLEVLADLPNYYNWIIEKFRPWLNGRIVEIGSGIGTISKLIFDDADQLALVEPSSHLTDYLPSSITQSKKVSIYNQTLEQRLPQMTNQSCDTIIMVNVLEHIEDDDAAIKALYRVLKPGGHLLLFVPALQYLYSALDREHGHFRRYHLAPLECKLNACGFKIEDSRYFDIAGVLPWWLINTLGKKIDFNPAMAKFYDRYCIPVTKFFERFISPPFGKNIMIVAERVALKPN